MNKLEEIKQRLENATPGPWEWVGCTLENKFDTSQVVLDFECETKFGLTGASKSLDARDSDKNFIAHAPEDIAYLLEENQSMRNCIRDLAGLVVDYKCHLNANDISSSIETDIEQSLQKHEALIKEIGE